NEATPNDAPGPPKIGVFVKLNVSARTCSRKCSVTWKFLNSDRSRFFDAGLRTSGRVRDTLPCVYGAGWLKTERGKYSFNRSTTEPSLFALCPLLFGLCVPFTGAPAPMSCPSELEVFTLFERNTGSPLENVAIPFTCQPPRIASATRFIPPPRARPLPAG